MQSGAAPQPVRRALAAAGAGLLVGGLAACGSTSHEPTGAYPIIPSDQRETALSFFGQSGRGVWTTASSSRGRILLLGFDLASAPAPKPQLDVLRDTYVQLRQHGVSLLRVTFTGRDMASVRVAVQGRIVTYPLRPAAELAARVHELAGAGLPYALILDRQGRIAARLIGTSDPQRLTRTVQRLIDTGE